MVRSLQIRPVLNGWVVDIGCQTVVFNHLAELCDAVMQYYRNPEATEKKFLANKLNDTMNSLPPAVTTECCGQDSAREARPVRT